MFKIKNSVQEYKWGRKDWLPLFLAEENPDNAPWAELWMGAHPKAPSIRLEDSRPLDGMIAEEGTKLLGEKTYSRYGRLPFLFKVLAVEEPLSIQVHPSKNQAEEGFDRENRLGIDVNAFNRNYRDDNHKPEIICAVEAYTAMKGFRPYEEIKRNFSILPSASAVNLFEGGTIRDFYFSLMGLNREIKDRLLEEASRLGDEDLAVRWVKKLMTFYPGDISALAPLFLNIVELDKGEALFLPAGELHAYLSGVGIELMANSDNVLRGGLTPKYMDLEELGKVVRFEHSPVEILKKGTDDLYFSGADEFVLGEKAIEGKGRLDTGGEASIVLVFDGEITLLSGNEAIKAGKGETVFIEAGKEPVDLEGRGTLYWATVKKDAS